MGKDSKLGIKGVWIIALFIVFLVLGFCREARSEVVMEIGPTVLSGESSEGGMVMVSETVGRWSFGAGYVSKQVCHCNWPARLDENIFVQAQRLVKYRAVDLGLGLAYFQNTNRALGKNLTFSLSVGWRFSDHWGATVRHYSNAGSGSPNLGQDALVIQYHF